MKKISTWIIIAAGVAVFVAALTRQSPRDLERFWVVPDLAFVGVTADGSKPMRTSHLKGHPWVVNFIFTRCGGPCPVMSAKMAALQRVLPPEIKMVSFTVDPDHDSAAVLKNYAERFHADPQRWIFARASKASLYKMVYEGFRLSVAEQRKEPPESRVMHSTKFVLVDQTNTVRAYYDSNDASFVKQIQKDAKHLTRELAT